MNAEVPRIVRKTTLAEKGSRCSGRDFRRTKSTERLGIGAISMEEMEALIAELNRA